MNHFIGTLHCRCKVITLALIFEGNFTPALRATVIDLTYADYSNSSWEILSEHWSQIRFSRPVLLSAEGCWMWPIILLFDLLLVRTCTSSLERELSEPSAVCQRQCGISMGGESECVCVCVWLQACCWAWLWKMSLISLLWDAFMTAVFLMA